MLVRARADLVKARVAAHNQLRTHLQLAHPGAVGLFSELDGKVSLAFLTRFPAPAPCALALREAPGHLAQQRPLHAGEYPHPGPAARPPAPCPGWAPRRARS